VPLRGIMADMTKNTCIKQLPVSGIRIKRWMQVGKSTHSNFCAGIYVEWLFKVPVVNVCQIINHLCCELFILLYRNILCAFEGVDNNDTFPSPCAK
jgi:hypothetical protein